ncbi:AI-2E family transporter, partial [Patescibacteria group bacterium]|nr:AI-2E family transporter [Patescibacteria group bacterium]
MSSTLNRKVVFDVSMAAFLKLAFIAFALLILYLVREVLLLMFLAIVIASALDPIIDFLQKKRIPRG